MRTLPFRKVLWLDGFSNAHRQTQACFSQAEYGRDVTFIPRRWMASCSSNNRSCSCRNSMQLALLVIGHAAPQQGEGRFASLMNTSYILEPRYGRALANPYADTSLCIPSVMTRLAGTSRRRQQTGCDGIMHRGDLMQVALGYGGSMNNKTT